MHNLMGSDLWTLGYEELSKINIVQKRKLIERRRTNKGKFRRTILENEQTAEAERNVEIMETTQLTNGNIPMLPSQITLRTIQNNLGLEPEAGGHKGSFDLHGSLDDALQADANQVFD